MINFREASTKRGIVWILAGLIVIYKTARGQNFDINAMLDKVDFWTGIAMNIAGAFGLLPDEKSTSVRVELPPVELVGKPGWNDASGGTPDSVSASNPAAPAVVDGTVSCRATAGGMRESELPARRESESGAVGGDAPPGWNG